MARDRERERDRDRQTDRHTDGRTDRDGWADRERRLDGQRRKEKWTYTSNSNGQQFTGDQKIISIVSKRRPVAP